MEVVNLLSFLNSIDDLYTLDIARCNYGMVNLLDLMTEDEQFTQTIDLGLVYIKQKNLTQYTIVDGLNRIVSLMLLLHAICECYKKTSKRNEKAIKTIRSKYIFKSGSQFKLHLQSSDKELFAKIINGERLSGHEKTRPMFVLLHNFWSQIKEEKLQASHIFKMLQKINITLVETDNVSPRNIYYTLNKEHREINQLTLIESYLNEKKVINAWNDIKSHYFIEKDDAKLFLKDFFITKFNFRSFSEDKLYKSFVNYFETMLKYMSTKDAIMKNIKRSAMLYYNMLYVNFENESIKQAFINIKRHGGSDTYAYILNVYEDFYTGNITESIFLEILTTIDEYLKNRQNSGKNIDFNELVQYLNALITYK